jgi:WD40 repeat protein
VFSKLRTLCERHGARRTLEGHSARVRGVAVTPDGTRTVSASWNNTLKVWDLDTGPLVSGGNGGRVYFLAIEE